MAPAGRDEPATQGVAPVVLIALPVIPSIINSRSAASPVRKKNPSPARDGNHPAVPPLFPAPRLSAIQGTSAAR